VTDKDSLRAAARAFRLAMPATDRDAARRAIRHAVLQRCWQLELPPDTRIACYEPLRTEPGSVELLDELRSAGYQVIVPVTLPDRDLDWLPWPHSTADRAHSADQSREDCAVVPESGRSGADSRPGTGGSHLGTADRRSGRDDRRSGTVDAAGSDQVPAETLGPAAIATAQLVLVPAFAVDRTGGRLGRGGGSYDRALARVPAGTIIAALIFAEELVEQVPIDAWDRPVTAVVSPAGWIELAGTGRGNT
jgi:5-formyltetrahydrofolate cyclo-ligase